MHLLVSVRGYAIRIVLLCIAITLPALSEAEDLAQGHHLWTVNTANGGKTFIAAGTYATDPRADVILHRQLKAIGNVKLVALSSDGRAPEIAKDAWMRKALFGLEPDAYRRHRDITGSSLADLARTRARKAGAEPHRGLGGRRPGRIARHDRDASEQRLPDHTASAA